MAFDAKNSVNRSMEKTDDPAREEATAPKFEPPPAEPAPPLPGAASTSETV